MNKVTIGRNPANDIQIDERWETVSGNHGEIINEGGTLTFVDHSTNGTIINGRKICNESVKVRPGDKVRLADEVELDWTVVTKLMPEIQSPDKEEKKVSTGRRTVAVNTSGKKGRMTQQFNSGANSECPESQKSYAPQFGQANEYSQSEIDKEIEKWNWGAFFCSWLWAAFNGLYWPLLFVIVAPVPYLGQVCSLSLSVYLAMNGSRLAWRKGKFKSFRRFKKAQRVWGMLGIIWFALYVYGNIYALEYALNLF